LALKSAEKFIMPGLVTVTIRISVTANGVERVAEFEDVAVPKNAPPAPQPGAPALVQENVAAPLFGPTVLNRVFERETYPVPVTDPNPDESGLLAVTDSISVDGPDGNKKPVLLTVSVNGFPIAAAVDVIFKVFP